MIKRVKKKRWKLKMKTKAEAKKWINSKKGKGTDWDGVYGY